MQLEKNEIESALAAKGFVKEETHHHYFYHEVGGKRTGISTYLSHGSKMKNYGDNLPNLIRKQLRLDNKMQLRDLVECRMEAEDYNSHLREKGLIRS